MSTEMPTAEQQVLTDPDILSRYPTWAKVLWLFIGTGAAVVTAAIGGSYIVSSNAAAQTKDSHKEEIAAIRAHLQYVEQVQMDEHEDVKQLKDWARVESRYHGNKESAAKLKPEKMRAKPPPWPVSRRDGGVGEVGAGADADANSSN